VVNCPTGMYGNNSSGNCVNCTNNCLTCINMNSC
jgi:hypothetical protein